MSFRNNSVKLILYLALFVGVVVFLTPFLYMVAVALTRATRIMPYPPILFPRNPYFGNFAVVWSRNNFGRYFLNSVFLACSSTIVSFLVATTSAYSFARFQFPGKEMIFRFFLISMMVPGLLNIVPQFVMIKFFRLVNTYTGLLLLYSSTGVAFQTFFLRGFFEIIPREMEESIRLDGGSRFTIYRYIMLPLSTPALATLAIFTFSASWDEFFLALTFIKSEWKRTLPIAIRLFQQQYGTEWGLVFAASLIAIIPIITIFVVFQKRFIRGELTTGAVKF
ncbi:MAG: carbohydrate ABC transporter permease [Spirochaetes bacterium]|nr:MAG: carbohydrate ABC transporter permease [Spirochaetota bacterium]